MLNEDYKEMLHILLGNEVKFLVVGAYALKAIQTKEEVTIEHLKIPLLSKANLIKNKKATGRRSTPDLAAGFQR